MLDHLKSSLKILPQHLHGGPTLYLVSVSHTYMAVCGLVYFHTCVELQNPAYYDIVGVSMHRC